jgi:hypothetical protein
MLLIDSFAIFPPAAAQFVLPAFAIAAAAVAAQR